MAFVVSPPQAEVEQNIASLAMVPGRRFVHEQGKSPEEAQPVSRASRGWSTLEMTAKRSDPAGRQKGGSLLALPAAAAVAVAVVAGGGPGCGVWTHDGSGSHDHFRLLRKAETEGRGWVGGTSLAAPLGGTGTVPSVSAGGRVGQRAGRLTPPGLASCWVEAGAGVGVGAGCREPGSGVGRSPDLRTRAEQGSPPPLCCSPDCGQLPIPSTDAGIQRQTVTAGEDKLD